jgi:hypothetical protein
VLHGRRRDRGAVFREGAGLGLEVKKPSQTARQAWSLRTERYSNATKSWGLRSRKRENEDQNVINSPNQPLRHVIISRVAKV